MAGIMCARDGIQVAERFSEKEAVPGSVFLWENRRSEDICRRSLFALVVRIGLIHGEQFQTQRNANYLSTKYIGPLRSKLCTTTVDNALILSYLAQRSWPPGEYTPSPPSCLICLLLLVLAVFSCELIA